VSDDEYQVANRRVQTAWREYRRTHEKHCRALRMSECKHPACVEYCAASDALDVLGGPRAKG
jgi:hypothetical protein